MTDPAQESKPAKSSTWKWWAGIVGALLLGIVIGALSAQPGVRAPAAAQPAAGSDRAGDPPYVAVQETTTPPPKLTVADFKVTPKITSKECYGSGFGCNVTVRLTVAGTDATDGVNAAVTVEVTGGEEGAITETIDVDEDGQYEVTDVDMQTRSSKTAVKVRVTDVATY